MTLRPRHALWLLPVALFVGVAGTWLTRSRNGPRIDTVHAVRLPLVQPLVTPGRVLHRRPSAPGPPPPTPLADALADDGGTWD